MSSQLHVFHNMSVIIMDKQIIYYFYLIFIVEEEIQK